MEFSVIDVETTGFSKRNDRIIEIAIIRINDSGQIIRTYESLINPMRDVGPSHIHGITASDVLNAPTFADLSNTVLDFLNGSVIVSHNKGFDLGFLESEFNRAGINVAKIDGICTLNLSKYLFPELPSRKLQVLCEYLDILIENAHRAYDDCLATAQLFHKMYETYLQEYTLEEFYGKFVRENIFSFPLKEKGTAIVEFKRDVSKNKVEIQEPKIRGILNRIPDNYKPAENSISEYLNLLDRILEDRLIAKEELKEIEEYTVLHGFSPAKLTKIQQEYFRRLVRYYLSDNIISELELLDLKQVATLLQIEDSDRDIII